MIIHPTRTNLLILRERSTSVTNSIEILKARRQALLREFLSTSLPFLRTRKEIVDMYGKALDELGLSIGHMGKMAVESITFSSARNITVDIIEKSIWGLKYKDIVTHEAPVRAPDNRGYDIVSTTSHLEEGIHLFEKILESLLELAAYESKIKRLGHEIAVITRKTRVLEERILPDLKETIKNISQYISEREREAYFRLKKFKELSHREYLSR